MKTKTQMNYRTKISLLRRRICTNASRGLSATAEFFMYWGSGDSQNTAAKSGRVSNNVKALANSTIFVVLHPNTMTK